MIVHVKNDAWENTYGKLIRIVQNNTIKQRRLYTTVCFRLCVCAHRTRNHKPMIGRKRIAEIFAPVANPKNIPIPIIDLIVHGVRTKKYTVSVRHKVAYGSTVKKCDN